MSPAMWGGVLGGLLGLGLILVGARVAAVRRPQLAVRVLPYVRDLTTTSSRPVAAPSAATAVFGPLIASAARGVESVLGGAHSVRRRLERAGLDRTVHDFRIEQVQWGLVGFVVVAAYSLVSALREPGNAVSGLVLCAVGFAFGVLLRDNRLSAQATERGRKILAEFPTIAELLALAIAAGESPVAALTRVVERSRGELSADLGRVLAEIRTGTPVGTAFDALAARTGLPLVARFCEGIAVAVERGTPLADVLHAQAADVREAGRRGLIETAARKEVLMMTPVVFIILPVTVLFAFWPGFIGLSLTSP